MLYEVITHGFFQVGYAFHVYDRCERSSRKGGRVFDEREPFGKMRDRVLACRGSAKAPRRSPPAGTGGVEPELADRARDQIDLLVIMRARIAVITSYSIHYTKLYESICPRNL